MDLKQVLQQGGGGNASSNNSRKGSCANSLGSQSEGGNINCGSNASTHTRENTSSPAAPLFSCGGEGGSVSSNNGRIYPASHSLNNILSEHPRPCDVEAHDPRLLKLARLHDPPSPLETQALINLNGSFHTYNTTHTHASTNLSSYLSYSNQSSNHASPTTNYPSSTCNLLHGGASLSSYTSPPPDSKLYPFSSLEDSRHHSPYMLSATSQAALLPSARALHANLPCFNPGPAVSLFTPEQLLEFTQQTYVFKHFASGVMPPSTLLLPIIKGVRCLGRMGAASMNWSGNTGIFGVGGLRGNVDPEPGRCRRTDGKKWRCSREVVADQKYCERHMHRGRHRGRANRLANVGAEGRSGLLHQPLNAAPDSANTHASNVISSNSGAPLLSTPKEPHLHFSLQSSSGASTQLNRSNSLNDSKLLSDPADGLKRLFQGHTMGGVLSSSATSLAARSQDPPNLAGLLKLDASSKASFNNRSPNSQMGSTFPFTCHTGDRDADNLALRQLGGGNHWPSLNRVADNPRANSSLSWLDRLAEEQNKRSKFNTELSIATHKSPLNLSTKFGSDYEEIVDPSHYMGLSMTVEAKVSGAAKEGARNSWVPIAWENLAIGGPLGEVLQANGANSSGNYSGSLDNNGEGCLNLIDESWQHNEEGHAKDSHSPSLASPSGVLHMKASFASYSDSSSSASSPRSALKLESANLGI